MTNTIDQTTVIHAEEEVTDPWNPGFTDLAVPPVILEGEMDVDVHARRYVEISIDVNLYWFTAAQAREVAARLVAGAALIEAAL